MVDDLTLGEGTAGPRARVTALLTDAGQVAGTLTVEDTLWTAVGWDSYIAGETGAGSDASSVPALREGPTGVRLAGVHRHGGPGGLRHWGKFSQY